MQTDVLLVSMPFAPLSEPSLGLSLLKAGIPEVRCEILYLTLPFAERLGTALYNRIADGHPSTTALCGEWIFSADLFDHERDATSYLEEVFRRETHTELATEADERRLLGARSQVETFLSDGCERILGRSPRIVGFTSVFQQHVASLALARRLKRQAPEITVLLGGANCESVMGRETVRRFPWVDAVVSGEGDRVFPRLVQRLLAGETFDDLPGVLTRRSAHAAVAPPVRDLDGLPHPDYEDFFRQWQDSSVASEDEPWITFETSRGCWWGEKHHCTFCGLNGNGMAFRSKSAERVLEELSSIQSSHPGRPIRVVDNILDMRYFKTLLPELARRDMEIELFFEVKSNLRKEQVRLLREAGVTRIQPGIESLSDDVLRRMRKGTTALQSIQLLKWCRELDVQPLWNLLWGFPGEDPASYRDMADLVPRLTHLAPPDLAIPIRLDRFSPNFEQGEELGFSDISPCPSYRHIYPFEESALRNLAYFFAHRYADSRDLGSYTQPLAERITEWQEAHAESALFYLDQGDRMLIWDFRPVAVRRLSLLGGLERDVYLACDAIAGVAQLGRRFEADRDGIEEVLKGLDDRKLIVRRDDRVLALAVRRTSPSDPSR